MKSYFILCTDNAGKIRTGIVRSRHVHVGVTVAGRRVRADHGDVVAATRQLREHRPEPGEMTLQRHGHERQHVRGVRGRPQCDRDRGGGGDGESQGRRRRDGRQTVRSTRPHDGRLDCRALMSDDRTDAALRLSERVESDGHAGRERTADRLAS